MPQTVEVGIERAVRSLDDVGDASGLQVEPEHVRGVVRPPADPHGQAGLPAAEEVPQQVRNLNGERLHGGLAVLGVLGAEHD